MEHIMSEDCWCNPRLECFKHEDGSVNWLIIHNKVEDPQ